MIFVAGDRELASGNLNHLPVGAQQLTGGSRANISPPAARSRFKYIEEGWHWATVHSHEDPAITCVCLGALSNTVGSAAEGGRRPTKPTRPEKRAGLVAVNVASASLGITSAYGGGLHRK